MIYLSLPYFYENQNFNIKFKEFLRDNPKAQNFSQQCVLESCYGNFPFSFWNGDKNNNFKNFKNVLTKEDINTFITQNLYSIIKFDFSNIYLTDKDLFDPHLNMILDTNKGLGNFIKISDIKIKDYIEQKYLGYDFILSENFFINNKLTLEEIKSYTQKDSIFYCIDLPSLFNKIPKELKKINNKNKITLTIGDRCSLCDFPHWEQCKIKEQLYQINYSIKTIDENENILINYQTLQNEINILTQLGFSYFKIKPFTDNLIIFNDTLIQTFIAPMYQGEFYRRLNYD